MIRLVKRVISWLKAIFKGEDMGYEFPNVEVAKIEKSIGLKEKAIEDGKHDKPRSDSRARSNCEEEAVVQSDEQRHNEVSKAAKSLGSIKKIIIDSAAELGKKHFFIDEIKAECQQSVTTAVGSLSNLIDSFKTEDRELENYKLENKISRNPRPLTTMSLIISIGVIVFLFIAEMRLNTKLLAPAMARGEEGGQAVALSVAILNVFVSFAAGYLFVKNIHHYRAFKRRISQIGLFIYTVFIIYLNGVMGAFRATAELAGKTKKWGQTVVEAVPGEQGNELLWFLGTVKFDVYPLILTFVGITFAIASLWDGYLFDDPYPGYGKVGKKREDDKKEINRIRQHLSTEVLGKANNEIKKTGERRDKLISQVITNWQKNVSDLENVFENYRRFATQIEDSIDHCMGEYRAYNSEYRKAPEPKYWLDENGEVKIRCYNFPEEKKDPVKVYPAYAPLYLAQNQIEQKLEKYQNEITEESNIYLNKLNDLITELNKIIEEIRSKYDPETSSRT